MKVSIILIACKDGNTLELTKNQVGWEFTTMKEEKKIEDFEIIFIGCPDKNGKDDGTKEIIDKLGGCWFDYLSIGAAFRKGMELAKYDKITFFTADNKLNIKKMLQSPDIFWGGNTTSFNASKEARNLKRRIVAWLYVKVCNLWFGYKLPRWSGWSVFNTADLKELNLKIDSPCWITEILYKLLKQGKTLRFIPEYWYPQENKKGRLVNFKNVLQVIKDLWRIKNA